MPIVAAAEQSLELYRQAGADECVRKGGSFLSRLPIAIEDAIKKRPAPAPRPAPSAPVALPHARSRQVLLRCVSGMPVTSNSCARRVEGLEPPLECVSLADALKDSDLQPGTTPRGHRADRTRR